MEAAAASLGRTGTVGITGLVDGCDPADPADPVAATGPVGPETSGDAARKRRVTATAGPRITRITRVAAATTSLAPLQSVLFVRWATREQCGTERIAQVNSAIGSLPVSLFAARCREGPTRRNLTRARSDKTFPRGLWITIVFHRPRTSLDSAGPPGGFSEHDEGGRGMAASGTTYENIPVRADGFTVDDLADMPDDGRRYEVLDGTLLVSPAPRWEHQAAVAALHRVLDEACPPSLFVFGPSPPVRRTPHTSLRPDLCVARREDLVRGARYRGTPVLVAEVLTPSSVGVDRMLKRHAYERLGVPFYWLVDEDESSVTVLTLTLEGYVEYAFAEGDRRLAVKAPFAVTIVPSSLTFRPEQG